MAERVFWERCWRKSNSLTGANSWAENCRSWICSLIPAEACDSDFLLVPRLALRTFGVEATERLKQIGREGGSTFSVTLLAAFKVLLWRYSRRQEILSWLSDSVIATERR